jgi:hypothetical protein
MTLSRCTSISLQAIAIFFVIDSFVVDPAYDDSVLPLYLFREQRRDDAIRTLRQRLYAPSVIPAYKLRGALPTSTSREAYRLG